MDQLWEDTLLAHHCFASHLPKSLSHVASVYCNAEPWKILHGKSAGEEKGEAPWDSDDVSNLLLYCSKDVKLDALAWQRMKPDLAPERKVYESDKRMALLCRGMTEVGIGFDTAKRDELASHLRARKRGLLGEMRQLVGPNFHPARLGDVRRALFVTFRGPMLYPTKTGLASTSNLTLEAVKVLDTRAGHLADLLLRWRACAKTLGSYVENYEPGRDGRIHAQWKLGPVTGRLAGPLMTLPRYGDDWETHVRGMYVADKSKRRSKRPRIVAQIHDAAIIEFDGQLFYYDLSQCEARLAAYFSGDENLIKACEKDIHTENAKVVFADIPEAMAKLNKAYELSPFLDNHGKPLKWKAVTGKNGGCKDERDITKNCGFCVWYEGTAERALATLKAAGKRATLAACEEFVRRFHSRYTRYYEFIDENEAFCKQHGYLRSVILGRISWLGWHAKRTDISNRPIQGGIADIHNDRLPRIEDRLKGCKSVDRLEKLVRDVWAEPIKVPHNGLEFVMPIDFKTGERWSDFG
jgi:DNA polymerase I-like protein with 3'-5' exonuclease and polymerase domains